jgi:ribosomal protein S18 acetylase RimI-like enzyme
MTPINRASQVFDAIQAVKSAAPAFCTNFFPTERKVQSWIEHSELTGEDVRDGTALFFRRDRDFWHLYFCAASPSALKQELASLKDPANERMVVDLVGNETTLHELLTILEKAGFRRYSKLQRMARAHSADLPASANDDASVEFALSSDRQAIADLLESSFDRYADQLPVLHEIDAAISNRQMLAIKCDDTLAAVLFYETQGMTSTIRYWAVADRFRTRRFGAALMRYYLQAHAAVRRFVLWVVSTNENAVQKYQHYGYAADGLIDHVLANQFVRP